MKFAWSEAKAQSNAIKHGVTFEEATQVFYDTLSDTADDPDHSIEDERFVILGMTSAYRLLYISFTEKDDTIRIISARAATRRERKLYENQP